MAAKSERIEVRLSAQHKALLEEAAALLGQSLSTFLVSDALDRARRLQHTTLTRRDWDLFLEIVDRDEEPTPALSAAIKKYRTR